MELITSKEEIANTLAKGIEDAINEAVYTLSYIGEQVVNAAKTSGKYLDQTGNLRSSIGYVISVNGELTVKGNFNVVKDGGQGAKGGEQMAEALAKASGGISLIVVAGMDYAQFVSAKGLDVLDSAEVLAESLIPQLLGELKI